MCREVVGVEESLVERWRCRFSVHCIISFVRTRSRPSALVLRGRRRSVIDPGEQ